MSNLRLSEKLLAKADQDLTVVSKWKADPDIAQEIIGFHAQQSAEKILKAVLAYYEIVYPITHRSFKKNNYDKQSQNIDHPKDSSEKKNAEPENFAHLSYPLPASH